MSKKKKESTKLRLGDQVEVYPWWQLYCIGAGMLLWFLGF